MQSCWGVAERRLHGGEGRGPVPFSAHFLLEGTGRSMAAEENLLPPLAVSLEGMMALGP